MQTTIASESENFLLENKRQQKPSIINTKLKNEFCGATVFVHNMHLGQGDINHSETMQKENFRENAAAIASIIDRQMSEKRLNQLKEAVTFHMNSNKYEKALRILENLIDHVEGERKILLLLQKTTCLIENDQIIEAGDLCCDVSALLDQMSSCDDLASMKDECFQDINTLITKLVEKTCTTSALLLVHRQFEIINNFFHESRDRLLKLRDLGGFVQDIATDLDHRGRGVDIKNEYAFMDKVLWEMEKVEDISEKDKTEFIAWFLKYYGYACCEVKDYPKSIDIYQKSIDKLDKVFKGDASRYKVYGHCYHNLGVAHKFSGHFDQAKDFYKKALAIYAKVTNWTDEQEKEDVISTTKICLSVIE